MLTRGPIRLGSVIVLASSLGACNMFKESNSQYAKGSAAPNQADAKASPPAASGVAGAKGHLSLTIPTLNSADGPVSKVVVAIMPAPVCWQTHHMWPASRGPRGPGETNGPGEINGPGAGPGEPGEFPPPPPPEAVGAGGPGVALPADQAVSTGSVPTVSTGAVQTVSTGTTGHAASLADAAAMGDGAPNWSSEDDSFGPNQWHHRFQGHTGLPFGPGCTPIISAVNYTPGASVSLDSVPVGSHLVLIAVIGVDGQVKETGHGHVDVSADGTATATVTVHPVNQTGSVQINIQEGGTEATGPIACNNIDGSVACSSSGSTVGFDPSSGGVEPTTGVSATSDPAGAMTTTDVPEVAATTSTTVPAAATPLPAKN